MVRGGHRWPHLVVLAILVVAAGAVWAVRGRVAPSSLRLQKGASPNVLLISIDTLRADYLGAYGAKLTTPAIDALARRGVVFDKALAQAPITLPSHASLMTSQYPIAHGVRDNGTFRVGESGETVAESFRAAGYRTAAFIGSFALDSRFGLDQGFELYDDFYGDTSEFNDFAISERPAEAVLEPAQRWLEQRKAEKWFVFIHLWDPHAPYLPPSPFREAHSKDLYGGEVAYTDHALGRFLERLRGEGRLDHTLIVLTADHGESLGEHGEKTHGMFAYESTLHVPLIFTWEGILPAGARVGSRVRLIDVAPTLLDLAGLEAPGGYQGISLLPLIADPGRREDRETYFESLAFHLNRNWAPLTGLYRGEYKFIDLPIPELYDMRQDPAETRNLYEQQPERGRQMRAALGELVSSFSTAESRQIRPGPVDQETARRLEALGYAVAGQAYQGSKIYTPEDDPKRLTALSDKLDQGVSAYQAGKPEESIGIFRELIGERPTFAKAYENLALVLGNTGRVKEAVDVLERAVELGIQTRAIMGKLGSLLQEAGRLEESVSLLESLVRDDPDYAEAYNYLAVSYARLGRTEKALAAIDKLLTLDPTYASAYSNRGSVYLGAGNLAAAETSYRKALEMDPRLASAWNGLGVVQARIGREDDAIVSWQRAIELDPRQYDTLYNLGKLLTKFNRAQEAVGYLERFLETAPADRYGADLSKVRQLVGQLRGRT